MAGNRFPLQIRPENQAVLTRLHRQAMPLLPGVLLHERPAGDDGCAGAGARRCRSRPGSAVRWRAKAGVDELTQGPLVDVK